AALLPISARDESSLQELAHAWIQRLAESPAALQDLCSTASLRRTHFEHRLVVRGRDREELASGLQSWLAGGDVAGVMAGRASAPVTRAAFVFSGVGSHWA